MGKTEAEELRILVIANLYPSARHPAFGTFIASRVEALRRAGAEVHVEAILRPVERANRIRKYAGLVSRVSRKAIAARLGKSSGFDVVEAHIAFPTGLLAVPVAGVLGAPVVLFAHGSDVVVIPWRNRLSAALARRTFRAADLIVANSEFLAGEITRRFQVDPARLQVVSPGIRAEMFAVPSGEPQERQGILFVGRLVAEKGGSVLLEAMSHTTLPQSWQTPLTIVGTGPSLGAWEAQSQELGVAVTFTGPLTPSQVADRLHRAAIVAVPSTCEEGLGLVALEGMASGTLVVASNIGGLKSIVTEGSTGFLAEPGDPRSLAAALQRAIGVLQDPSTAAEMVTAARNTARAHDVDASARRTLELYEGVLAARG